MAAELGAILQRLNLLDHVMKEMRDQIIDMRSTAALQEEKITNMGKATEEMNAKLTKFQGHAQLLADEVRDNETAAKSHQKALQHIVSETKLEFANLNTHRPQ